MLLEDYQESFNSAASLVIRLMLSKKKSSEQVENDEWPIQLNGVLGAKNLSKTLFQLIKKYENGEEL